MRIRVHDAMHVKLPFSFLEGNKIVHTMLTLSAAGYMQCIHSSSKANCIERREKKEKKMKIIMVGPGTSQSMIEFECVYTLHTLCFT